MSLNTLLNKTLSSFDLYPNKEQTFELNNPIANLSFVNVEVSNTYAVQMPGQSGTEATVYAQLIGNDGSVVAESSKTKLGEKTRTTVSFNIQPSSSTNNIACVRLKNDGPINWCNAQSQQTLKVVGFN